MTVILRLRWHYTTLAHFFIQSISRIYYPSSPGLNVNIPRRNYEFYSVTNRVDSKIRYFQLPMNYRLPYVESYSIHASTCNEIDYISSCIRAGSKDDLLGSTENMFGCLSWSGRFLSGALVRGEVNNRKEMAYRNYEGNSEFIVAKLL